jgi:hypothetical protein
MLRSSMQRSGMKYEATIHFEVKDGGINLARLIAD